MISCTLLGDLHAGNITLHTLLSCTLICARPESVRREVRRCRGYAEKFRATPPRVPALRHTCPSRAQTPRWSPHDSPLPDSKTPSASLARVAAYSSRPDPTHATRFACPRGVRHPGLYSHNSGQFRAAPNRAPTGAPLYAATIPARPQCRGDVPARPRMHCERLSAARSDHTRRILPVVARQDMRANTVFCAGAAE